MFSSMASDFTFTSGHVHHWVSLPLGLVASFLALLLTVLHSSPVAYWTPFDPEDSTSGVISFCLFILFMGRILEWFAVSPSGESHFVTTLPYNLSILGRPAWKAGLIASLSYSSPFTMSMLWSSGKKKKKKNLPANAGDASLISRSKDLLEKEMATHSSILAWETPRTEEPGSLVGYSPRGHKEST